MNFTVAMERMILNFPAVAANGPFIPSVALPELQEKQGNLDP